MWLAVYTIDGSPPVTRSRLCDRHPFLELAAIRAEWSTWDIQLQSFQELSPADVVAYRRARGETAATASLTVVEAARLLQEVEGRRMRRAQWVWRDMRPSVTSFVDDDGDPGGLTWSNSLDDRYDPSLEDLAASDWEIVEPEGPAGGP